MTKVKIDRGFVGQIATVAKGHGVARACMSGSVARGEVDAESDPDLRVEFEPGRTPFDLVSVEEELEQLLGVDVHVATPKALYPEVMEATVREGISKIREYTGGGANPSTRKAS